MLKRLHITNFKSIYDETIELGRFNVFIGENGSGKTNILEALGMVSAATENKLSNDELALKGIRVAKPTITFSSFLGEKQKENIELKFLVTHEKQLTEVSNLLTTNNVSDIFSKWQKEYKIVLERGAKRLSEDDFYEEIIGNFFNLIETDEFKKEVSKSGRNIAGVSNTLLTSKAIQKLYFHLHKENLVTNIYENTGLNSYEIFNLSTQTLRGIGGISREIPGIRGENLDRLIESFDKEERTKLEEYAYFINWLEKIEIDKKDQHKLKGHKLDMSTSILYFRDKYMQRKNNLFSAENANEGVLHILFYLALFISKHTSKFFAIDNIETALNPELCKKLTEQLVKLSKETKRQVLITTHSPAVLDGLNLHDPEQRLFKVYRNKKGHTKVKRIELKPDQNFDGQGLKLSELWMRNYIGAIPQNL